jgi:DNA gyrase/topoisomerase IV subunit B
LYEYVTKDDLNKLFVEKGFRLKSPEQIKAEQDEKAKTSPNQQKVTVHYSAEHAKRKELLKERALERRREKEEKAKEQAILAAAGASRPSSVSLFLIYGGSAAFILLLGYVRRRRQRARR